MSTPSTHDTILELDNVSKFFGKVIALSGINLKLRRGEVHCLLGDNGAGKSTLIKTLAGVHPPSEGRYLVDGQPVSFESPKDALDLGIATVYQDLALVPLLSVARNFFMGREPKKKLFGFINLSQPLTLYYVVLGFFLFGFLVIYRAINSPFGEVLKSIRENEQRAISLGYRTDQYKLLAFILSGALAGLAGAVKVLVAQTASLTDVHWTMSGEVVLIVLLGGLGTIFGPVVGAFVIIAMQQYLAPFGQWVLVIQGVIFVVCVLAFRRGIVGEIAYYSGRSL